LIEKIRDIRWIRQIRGKKICTGWWAIMPEFTHWGKSQSGGGNIHY
jgi:hypothetical protein